VSFHIFFDQGIVFIWHSVNVKSEGKIAAKLIEKRYIRYWQSLFYEMAFTWSFETASNTFLNKKNAAALRTAQSL